MKKESWVNEKNGRDRKKLSDKLRERERVRERQRERGGRERVINTNKQR
jgi:hypothetical protein